MITPVAGSASHRWSSKPGTGPGPQGHPEERRQKTKARYQSLGATSSPSLSPNSSGSSVALVVICCNPFNPPGPSLIPLKRVQGKNLSWAGLRESSGESPACPELHNQITVILHHSAHEHTHANTYTHSFKHSSAELSSREGPGSGHSMRSPLV